MCIRDRPCPALETETLTRPGSIVGVANWENVGSSWLSAEHLGTRLEAWCLGQMAAYGLSVISRKQTLDENEHSAGPVFKPGTVGVNTWARGQNAVWLQGQKARFRSRRCFRVGLFDAGDGRLDGVNVGSQVAAIGGGSNAPVSYTHLDVYKRQEYSAES